MDIHIYIYLKSAKPTAQVVLDVQKEDALKSRNGLYSVGDVDNILYIYMLKTVRMRELYLNLAYKRGWPTRKTRAGFTKS